MVLFFFLFGLKLKTKHDFNDLVCIRQALKIKYKILSINVANKNMFLKVKIITKHPGK